MHRSLPNCETNIWNRLIDYGLIDYGINQFSCDEPMNNGSQSS